MQGLHETLYSKQNVLFHSKQQEKYNLWTLCCFLLLCHRCDKNPACSLIWRFQCIYFCCSYPWILRKWLYKIPMLRLIMLFQMGNLHHSYSLPGILSTWVFCWLKGEWMQICQSILLQIVDFHCPLFFEQWTWNTTFSCSYNRQNVTVRTAPKTKVKVKNCARSSERPTCLCIVGTETSPGIHVLTQPKHMVKE